MFKNILAVVAGVFVGMFTIFLVELLAHQFYPLPTELNLQDSVAMGTYLASAPAGSLLLVLLAYAMGAFLGGMVAARMAISKAVSHALMVGFLLLLAGVVNFYTYPHPGWFIVSSVAIYLLMSFFGGIMGSRHMP